MKPEGTRLKHVAQIIAGQSPASDDVTDLVDGPPFIQGNAEFGFESPIPRLQCEKAPKMAVADDLLLSVRAPVGAINIASESIGIGRGVCAIRPRAVSGRFLWWWLHDQADLLDAVSTGSTFKAVNASQIGDLRLTVTDLEQQRAIADFLDRETAQIDAMVNAQERLVSLLEERRQALILYAVTKGLNGEQGLVPSGSDLLGELPGHWHVSRMRAAVNRKKSIVGDQWSQYLLLSLTLNGVIPRDLENVVGKMPADFTTYQAVNRDDIIFCLFDVEETPRTVGWVPQRGMVTGAYTVAGVRAGFYPKFVAYHYQAFDQTKAYRRFYAGLRNTIRWNDFSNIPIASPPLAEQVAIADYLDTTTSQIDTMIAKAQQSIALMQERRAALISAAVTGRIDVRTGTEHVERELEEAMS